MEDRKRNEQMLVVADADGNIIAASWPGPASEDAPTEVGIRVADEHTVYEVEVPDEFKPADLGQFRLNVEGAAQARLEPNSH